MQDLFRWIIELAPSVATGIAIIAALRTVIGLVVQAASRAHARRSEALREALEAWKKNHADLPEVERMQRAAVGIMAETVAVPLLYLVVALAFMATTIWFFVAVWAVTATLPGIWGQPMWWVGLLRRG